MSTNPHYVPHDKKELIKLIMVNGSWNGHTAKTLEQNFEVIELEGILEYGDPRAFWDREFSDERSYYYDKFGKSLLPHQPLRNQYAKIQEDLKLAEKLGGYAMQKRIKKTLKSDDALWDSKRKIITQILHTLPEKFRNVKKYILENDLYELCEFCKPYYKPKILKFMILIIEDRCKIQGLYVNHNELLKHYGVKRKSLMKMRYLLKDAGFFEKTNEENIQETIKTAAFNVLFELKERHILNKRTLMMAQSNVISFADKYPDVLRAREQLGKVVAFLSLRLIQPQIKLKELCQVMEADNKLIVQSYQAAKRAEQRSEDYRIDLQKSISNNRE